MASSSSVSVFDNHRFKTAFNEELYNTIVKNKKVIAECCIDLDEDEYPEVKEQISLRGWRRLSAPKQEINIDLIHEFYANVVVTEEEMEEAGGHTFRSFVTGVPVDFSPGNIQTVMRYRTQVQGAATDFETRKEHDQPLDQVLADLCMPGATWKLSTGVPLREFRRSRKIQVEKPITARRMESTRLPRPVQRRQQEDEEEDHPMPQAGEGNEEENVEEQGQDQKLLGKEILDVKKYQMSAVTMGSGGSSSSPQPQRYEPNQALLKIREQHANFIEITRQLRDWTRNASARETYTVWAHQQANPNLVEMSSQKIVKQIYDNMDHKRPIFKGLLKSDLQPSNPAPPPSSSNDPKDPPK
ncbi:hypothetical protein PIB30_092072 [Stylosanthes scabra]|uniref:Putative plant transposon protein domain-containing protein n=1 Tax=Stylosanthes scabra TaxID=79078 RepID=A0ABU6RVF9_9FABA|nr:hypothetical protein [Stylosanthes scabra]